MWAYFFLFPTRQRTWQTSDTSLTVILTSTAHKAAVSGKIERPYYVAEEIDEEKIKLGKDG